MKIAPFSTRRLEALTDGVFAIAMTLLVLSIGLPAGENIRSNADLLTALGPLRDNMISFVISFVILAIVWAVHVRQFEGIKKIDSRVLLYNNIRLFIVVLIPFTTSLLGEYGNVQLAIVLYPLSLFALGLISAIQGQYLAQHPDYFENFDADRVRSGRLRSNGFAAVAGLVLVASFFIGTYAFFLYFLNSFIPAIFKKRG